MTTPLLDQLRQDSFVESVGFLLPPAPLRRALQRIPVVQLVHSAVRRGQITERMVREFSASLAAEYQPGKLLPGDLAMAALAVAMESSQQDFAEEYLCDLARLQLTELPNAIRVARECLKARCTLPKTQIRIFDYPGPIPVPTQREPVAEQTSPRMMRRQRSIRYTEVAGVK